nr:molybdopterin-dependent oxidoreductase [Candidatus Microthrix sp.]
MAWLVMDLPLWRPQAADKVSESTDRRRFWSAPPRRRWAAAAGGLGRVLSGVFKVSTNRDDIALPAPADPAVTLPSGVDPDIEGLTPFITPVDKFYRVDTALEVPRVNGDDWELKVQGMVDEERSYSLADLLDRKLVERTITLVCVRSGGRHLCQHRQVVGVPLAEILDEAGVQTAPTAAQPLGRQLHRRNPDRDNLRRPRRPAGRRHERRTSPDRAGIPSSADRSRPVRLCVGH